MFEEVLQIAEKRREAKGKGEKETYIHLNSEFQRIARKDKKAFLSDQCKDIEENKRKMNLNVEFQRIARRDKKAFLSDQCKEIEGNNRMGKTKVSSRK